MAPPVVTSSQSGTTVALTLNRPEVLNAMDDALLEALAEALGAARQAPECRVVVLRGAGRVFCAGGDVNDMPVLRSESEYRSRRLAAERALAKAVRELDRPLIAQIHGAAVGGGCVLAALCDIRIAAEGSRFSLPETAFGTTASLGGIFMLTRIIGLGRAFELLYLGESFDAQRAFEIGLVNRVVPAADLDSEVSKVCQRIAEQFPREMMLTRRAILDGLDLDFQRAAERETEAAMQAHLSGDVIEGFKRARERINRRRGAN
jgi:enoyl-CoA hydratase/carnithine racemase